MASETPKENPVKDKRGGDKYENPMKFGKGVKIETGVSRPHNENYSKENPFRRK